MGVVRIVPWQQGWADQFEVIAAKLTSQLGELALQVHHIGSTAVPGLAAKDIIDVMVSVAEERHIEQVCAVLATHGYRVKPVAQDHVPEGSGDDEQWVKGYASLLGSPSEHLHIRVSDRANHRYALLFRDCLRAHPLMAASYAEVKTRLGELWPDDSARYAEVKDPICDLIYLSAQEWAARTGWGP